MTSKALPPRSVFHAARRALGIDRLVLVVHDSMFPSLDGEDAGRGSPYSNGARALYEFARDLGFSGVQFGPQGETSAVNPSPYDGTVFARTVLSIDFARLARDPLWSLVFDRGEVAAFYERAAPRGERVAYARVYRGHREMVDRAFERFRRAPSALESAFRAFSARQAHWMDRDARFEALAAASGTDDWRLWPAFEPGSGGGSGAVADRFSFGQWVAHDQHHASRRELASADWKMYGDLQIGISFRDRWARGDLFMDGWAMGAPPSRTDPLGQAWGFPVADPESEGATALLRARAQKMFAEFDGLRIDHPHGLVTPWVYDAHARDALAAVAAGTRLFDSPDMPALRRLAIARSEQIELTRARFADGWVRSLDDAQVDRYARSIAVLVDAARDAGRDTSDVLCEVLSTQPYPLRRVMQHYGLGRFVVTQKASLVDRADVYRSENAEPNDWIMFGNHDTAPLPLVVDRWAALGNLADRARDLATRLRPGDSEPFAQGLIANRRAFVQALFADMFVSRARSVSLFASDLFGLRAIYNRPGIVDDINWTLRIPNDFRSAYAAAVERGDAADIAGAFALALGAASHAGPDAAALIRVLEGGA